MGTRIGRTSGPILTIYTSYDVFRRKDVPFGGYVDIALLKGVSFNKTVILGRDEAF